MLSTSSPSPGCASDANTNCNLADLALTFRDAAPSDLQFLTEENIAEIGKRSSPGMSSAATVVTGALDSGSTMTHVERMRLQAALQALGGERQTLARATSRKRV